MLSKLKIINNLDPFKHLKVSYFGFVVYFYLPLVTQDQFLMTRRNRQFDLNQYKSNPVDFSYET